MRQWEKKFIVTGMLASLAIVVGMTLLWFVMNPPRYSGLPAELIKVSRAEGNNVTMTLRWVGGDNEGLLTFACPESLHIENFEKIPAPETDEKAAFFKYIDPINRGYEFNMTIPESWHLELHDGPNLAIELYPDGRKYVLETR